MNIRKEIEDFTKTLPYNFRQLDYEPKLKTEWTDQETNKVKKQLAKIFSLTLSKIKQFDKTNFTGLRHINLIDEALDNYFGLAYTSSGYYADLSASTNYWHYINDTDYITGFALEDNKIIAITNDKEENTKFWLIGTI